MYADANHLNGLIDDSFIRANKIPKIIPKKTPITANPIVYRVPFTKYGAYFEAKDSFLFINLMALSCIFCNGAPII